MYRQNLNIFICKQLMTMCVLAQCHCAVGTCDYDPAHMWSCPFFRCAAGWTNSPACNKGNPI